MPKPAPPAARRLEAMPLSAIKPAKRNYKQHAAADIDRSVAKFGVVDLVVLDERTGRLVSGHGRVESLKRAEAAGGDPPEGVDVAPDGTWLIPVVRGWASRSDEEAEAYLIAANKLTEKGGFDELGLAEMLADLQDAGLAELTGYSQDDIDDLIAVTQETGNLILPEDEDRHPHYSDDEDEEDPLAKQQRTTPGIAERRDDYQSSTTRVLVLSYDGDVYVWLVGKLAALLDELGVETNSDAVLKLIEERTGTNAPVTAAAADAALEG